MIAYKRMGTKKKWKFFSKISLNSYNFLKGLLPCNCEKELIHFVNEIA